MGGSETSGTSFVVDIQQQKQQIQVLTYCEIFNMHEKYKTSTINYPEKYNIFRNSN
jgi:hypothetical protein